MKSFAILLPLLLAAGSVAAKGDSKHAKHDKHDKQANSTASECGEISRLTHIIDIANNQTELTKVTKGNATRAAELQAQASSDVPKLQALQSNTTLVSACAAIFAAQEMDRQCGQIHALERLEKLAANATELAKVTKNNATRAADIQAKASSEAPVLSALQANTTLTAYCSVLQTKEECKAMKKMQKEVDLAKNTTALDNKFHGNATKIAEFQARASKVAQKLATLQGNSTLVSACAAINKSSDTEAATASSGAVATRASMGGMATLLVVFMGAVLFL